MNNKRPYALSIAGFDPSAGAGILADIKTFEQCGVYGLGVTTAVTVQNDKEFISVEWIGTEIIIKQIEILLKRFEIKFIKIGLIKNFATLQTILNYLHTKINNPVIVFDPILKASAGFTFHQYNDTETIELLKKTYCITPNLPEMIKLFGNFDSDVYSSLPKNTGNIFLKGGHTIGGDTVTDVLFFEGKEFSFTHQRLPHGEKHGSGCVLSAALTAQLALGNDLKIAAKIACDYTFNYLASNDTLLGYHNTIK